MVVRPSALQRGGDKNAPQAPLERICAQYGRCFASFVSSTASDKRGFVKGEARSPLTVFCLLLHEQK